MEISDRPVPDRAFHDVENLDARFACLRQRLAHHFHADAVHLDVHLQRRDSLPRSGHFEVHVAVVILGAGDVGEDGVLIALHHQAHRNSGARSLERHARVHQRKRSAAHGGHRRRTVRFQNVGNHAHGVREIRFRRKQVRKRSFGQRSVPDFASARTAQEFHFAHRERREVVVQHEALERLFLEQQIEALHVFLRAECCRSQRLRFAASEQRRTVHSRQHAHFARNLANLVERAPIRTPVPNQHVVAENPFAQPLERAMRQLPLVFVFFRNRGENFLQIASTSP